MHITDIPCHPTLHTILTQTCTFTTLLPAQKKAVEAGLLQGKNLLICTPTASGKTFIAELAMLQECFTNHKKALYIVPLKALATEKYTFFKNRYATYKKVGYAIGNNDSAETHLNDKDIIILTSEKLDSLIRHHVSWLKDVGVLIIDEIHLLQDASRGPTLEILITILRQLLPHIHIVALSATIGNAPELAVWLQATLIQDTWRPVELQKAIYYEELKIYK